jgi:hypothetical protein
MSARVAAVRWRFQKNIPYIPAPLLYQGVFYMVKTGGIVTTLDPATGTLLKEGRATGALGGCSPSCPQTAARYTCGQ